MEQNKDITLHEVASRGGKATLLKYGKEHYRRLARHMNETIKTKYGPDYYKNLSRLGVEARRKKRELASTT